MPSLPALLDICDYFDITPKDFFDEEIEPESPMVLKILKNLKDLPEEELSEILNITEKYQLHKRLKERMAARRK